MKKTLLLTLLVLFLLPFTAMSQLICGDTFTDNGGTDANYQNNTYEITFICSSIPGENVVVTFTSFDVESSWDGLLVYDGDSISSTQIASSNGVGSGALATIPGAFWGTTIPGPKMVIDSLHEQRTIWQSRSRSPLRTTLLSQQPLTASGFTRQPLLRSGRTTSPAVSTPGSSSPRMAKP